MRHGFIVMAGERTLIPVICAEWTQVRWWGGYVVEVLVPLHGRAPRAANDNGGRDVNEQQ